MCGGAPSLPPAVDPKAEREAAAADAARAANTKAIANKQAKRNQSLLATGAQGSTAPVATSSVLAYGKDKLGS